MKKILPILLLLITGLPYANICEASKITFEQHPVKLQFSGQPAPVKIDPSSKAYKFRTVIREGASKGPNFAGKFTVIEWGRGSGFSSFAIVDASSGVVYLPEDLKIVSFPAIPEESLSSSYGVSFRRDSNLFVIRGLPGDHEKLGTYYFLWESNKLRLLFNSLWPSEFNK